MSLANWSRAELFENLTFVIGSLLLLRCAT